MTSVALRVKIIVTIYEGGNMFSFISAKVAPYAIRTWNFANSNLVSILIGGTVSHQLTKSYRDQEIKELLVDVKNLEIDVKNRDEDIKKINVFNDGLRTKFIKQGNKLSSSEIRNMKCERSLSEYKFSYDTAPSWCLFLSKPKVLPDKFFNEVNNSSNENNNLSKN